MRLTARPAGSALLICVIVRHANASIFF
uniref:Uncharacterized protein n=1 Tax=Anguilla anguilla TaxID=7936 RepID=A0A0E9QYS5_ANGAN